MPGDVNMQKQPNCTLAAKHKWVWIKNFTQKKFTFTASGAAGRFTLKGIYKYGLPYGTSPSQKEAFARAQRERDKTPFLDAFLIAGVVCIAGIFLLSYFLKP